MSRRVRPFIMISASLLSLIAAAVALVPFAPAAARTPRPAPVWSPIGPLGGYVLGLAASPHFATDRSVYAVGPGGVFVSSDGASSWQGYRGGLRDQILRSVAVADVAPGGATLIGVTLGGKPYRSLDGGASWTPLVDGLGQNTVTALAISPTYRADGTMFAGTSQGSLFRLTSHEPAWSMVHAPLLGKPVVNDIAISPAYARDRFVVVATSSGLVVSRNGGILWHGLAPARAGASTQTASDYTALAFSPSFATDHTLYAGSTGLIVSHDGGATWSAQLPIAAGMTVQEVVASPAFVIDGTLLVIATSSGAGTAFVSHDRGKSWKAVGSPIVDYSIYSVAFSPAYGDDHTIFLGAGGQGVFVSSDGGQRWVAATMGFNDHVITSVALSPAYGVDHTLYVATLGAGVYRSRTNGATWTPVGGGINGHYDVNSIALSPLFTQDHQVFLGAANAYLRSRDAGQSWDFAYANLANQNVATVLASPTFARDGTVVAGGSLGGGGTYKATVFDTQDGGKTWQEQDQGVGGDIVKALAYSPSFATDHTLYIGTGPLNKGGSTGRVYVTHDAAATWKAVGHGFSGLNVLSLALTPGYPADGLLFAGTGDGLFISRDRGVTWSRAGVTLPREAILSVVTSPTYESDHTVFAASPDGLSESTDQGLTWSSIGGSLGTTRVQSLAISPTFQADHTILAATFNGLWLGVIGGPGSAPSVPTSVVGLGQQGR